MLLEILLLKKLPQIMKTIKYCEKCKNNEKYIVSKRRERKKNED